MSWLDRLKELRQKADELPRHRRNRQNPGFVSFGSAAVAQAPSSEGQAGDDAETAREAFEERAAIMEYDGGISRADAEHAARAPEPVRWRGEGLDLGDLRPCAWCRNLTRGGRCLAAWRGELRAAKDYAPGLPGQAQRCIGYSPPEDDPDQRPGRERWPELVRMQARVATLAAARSGEVQA